MDIRDWLRNALADGPADTRTVSQAARKEGYRRKELKEARHELGVQLLREKDNLTGETTYFWALPEGEL